VRPDDSLANGKLFIDISKEPGQGITDGMRVDTKGNLYETAPGNGIWIISPDGKHLGTINVPEMPANLAFGDADKKTLYIAARTGIYRIRVNTPGI
jgi:gluconolactonase